MKDALTNLLRSVLARSSRGLIRRLFPAETLGRIVPEITATITGGVFGEKRCRLIVRVINREQVEIHLRRIRLIAPKNVALTLSEGLAYPLRIAPANAAAAGILAVQLQAAASAVHLDHGSILASYAWSDRDDQVVRVRVRIEGADGAFWEPWPD